MNSLAKMHSDDLNVWWVGAVMSLGTLSWFSGIPCKNVMLFWDFEDEACFLDLSNLC